MTSLGHSDQIFYSLSVITARTLEKYPCLLKIFGQQMWFFKKPDVSDLDHDLRV
jgi:hypothetical protein